MLHMKYNFIEADGEVSIFGGKYIHIQYIHIQYTIIDNNMYQNNRHNYTPYTD
jgi:hypothetical protein